MTLRHLALVAAQTVRVAAPTLGEHAIGRLDAGTLERRLDLWSQRLVRLARIELHVHDREHADVDETFVLMSNHQSHFDIPCLYQAFRRPLRMVAKRELFRIPVMGPAMRVARFVEVDRDDHARAVASLTGARRTLADGISIWIAPEGTRSPTGRLGPFKKGGFHLALEAGARILPVSVEGTRRTLPAKSLQLREHQRVDVRFAAPVDPRHFGKQRLQDLMQAVRDAIRRSLPPDAPGRLD